MSKLNRYRTFLLFAAYFLFWMIPRYEALNSNTLQMDDFWLYQQNIAYDANASQRVTAGYANGTCLFPPQDGRWGLVGTLCVLAEIDPAWSVSAMPKVLAGCFLSIFAVILFLILREWEVNGWPAALLPLILLAHPIVNEITLWNMTSPFPLVMVAIAGGYLLVMRVQSAKRLSLAFALLIAAVLTYEVYLALFLLFIFGGFTSTVARGKTSNFRATATLCLLFLGVSVCYVLVAVLSKKMGASGRGLVEFTSANEFLREKYHGLFNLVVNVYSPVISFFMEPARALSVWKWIPVAIAVFTVSVAWARKVPFVYVLLLGLYALTVVVVPALPVLAASQSPEAWRVSVPALVAAILSLVPATIMLCRDANIAGASKHFLQHRFAIYSGAALVAILLVLEIAVTRTESKLRLLENAADKQIAQNIASYWQNKNISRDRIKVGVLSGQHYSRSSHFNSAEGLTVAYHRRGSNSAFDHYFSWRGFVLHEGFRVVEVASDLMTPKLCELSPNSCQTGRHKEFAEKCRSSPTFAHELAGIRIVHDDADEITVVCV